MKEKRIYKSKTDYMNIAELQQELFQLIKTKLAADASVADEIAKLLSISSDSAYRRMRGDKQITLEELYIIATKYGVSVDQLMNIETGGFLFQGNLLNSKTFQFDAYLTSMLQTLAYFNSFKENEVYYLCKETPIFHYFNIRALAAFKYYFWMITLIGFPEFKNKKVSVDEYPDELFGIGQKVVYTYNQLNSSEVWTIESWNSTLHQIDYYLDSRMFKSDDDALKVYEAMERLLIHFEEQAKLGYKFNIEDPEKKPMGKYHMYFNETVLQDNSVFVLLDNIKMSSVSHTTINYMMTRDVNYCENHYQYIQNLLKKSTLISEVSEKERSRYFRRMRERIDKRKESLHI